MTNSVSSIFKDIPAFAGTFMEYKTVIDNLTSAIFLVDVQLCLKYLNPAGEELLGTGVRRAHTRALTEFIQDVDGGLIPHIYRSIQTGHPIIEREICIKR